jgi:hypothetical protein
MRSRVHSSPPDPSWRDPRPGGRWRRTTGRRAAARRRAGRVVAVAQGGGGRLAGPRPSPPAGQLQPGERVAVDGTVEALVPNTLVRVDQVARRRRRLPAGRAGSPVDLVPLRRRRAGRFGPGGRPGNATAVAVSTTGLTAGADSTAPPEDPVEQLVAAGAGPPAPRRCRRWRSPTWWRSPRPTTPTSEPGSSA